MYKDKSILNVDGIPVILERSARRKRLRLLIEPMDCTVHLSVPKACSDAMIDYMLLQRRDWIKQKMIVMSLRHYMITELKAPASVAERKRLVSLLESQIDEHLRHYEPLMKLPHADYNVRLLKSCWGKCWTSRHRLTFSLYLAYLPSECVEYVVVHELCHFISPHHDKKFYDSVSQFFPNWKKVKEAMRYYYIT